MPRIARFLREDEKAIYHVISRTALDGLPFKDVDREYLVELIKKWSRIFFGSSTFSVEFQINYNDT